VAGLAVWGIHEAASLEWPSTPCTRDQNGVASSAWHTVTFGTRTERTSPQRHGR
jgi:hypothetical protein